MLADISPVLFPRSLEDIFWAPTLKFVSRLHSLIYE